jgi:hypothetical protein
VELNVRYGLGVATAVVLAATAMGVSWADPPGAESPAAVRAFAAASTREPAAGDDACGARQRARSVADVIDPDQWYLTLPTGKAGDPDTVDGAKLTGLSNAAFQFDRRRGGVQFRATAGGVTTKNSDYPRSELREETGGEHAAWSNTSGVHTLDVCQAVTELPKEKPDVVTAQIHDDKSDVMEVRLEGTKLIAQYADGKKDFVLDPAYRLGTPYAVRIQAADGKITVSYNGKKMGTIDQSGSGWYFKTGSYVQSNTDKGEKADAAGSVVLYSAVVCHDGAAARSSGQAKPTATARPSADDDDANKDSSTRAPSARPDRDEDSSMRESSDLPTRKARPTGY